jgi:hypothetical protein
MLRSLAQTYLSTSLHNAISKKTASFSHHRDKLIPQYLDTNFADQSGHCLCLIPHYLDTNFAHQSGQCVCRQMRPTASHYLTHSINVKLSKIRYTCKTSNISQTSRDELETISECSFPVLNYCTQHQFKNSIVKRIHCSLSPAFLLLSLHSLHKSTYCVFVFSIK